MCELDVAAGPLVGTVVEPEEVPLAIDELPLVALLGCFAEGETVVTTRASPGGLKPETGLVSWTTCPAATPWARKLTDADRSDQRSPGSNVPSDPAASFWSRGQRTGKSADARRAMSSSVA